MKMNTAKKKITKPTKQQTSKQTITQNEQTHLLFESNSNSFLGPKTMKAKPHAEKARQAKQPEMRAFGLLFGSVLCLYQQTKQWQSERQSVRSSAC